MADDAGVTPREVADHVRRVVDECYAEVMPAAAPEADFFASGGDSLQLVRLVARIQQTFGVEVAAEDFFRAPSPRVLAALVLSALGVESR